MSRAPADIGGAPVHVLLMEVEDPFVRGGDPREVAAGRVDDALGLARGPGRIEEVEQVLGVHRLGPAASRHALDEVVPPDAAPALHLARLPGALANDDPLHPGRPAETPAAVLLE